LVALADVNRKLELFEEGIRQAMEALEIYERLGDAVKQGYALIILAWLLCEDNQLEAAEEAASRAVQLLAGEGREFLVSDSHRVLGEIYRSKGEREKAIHHFEAALEIASAFNWDNTLFWIHDSLAMLFLDEDEFDDADAHVEQAELHVASDEYNLGCAVRLRALVLRRQRRFEDATSEALRALEIFEKLGALMDSDWCRTLLRDIEREAKSSDILAVVSFRKRYLVPH
jgi:tetratricopeptide (TPR) repeat protein